MTKIKLINPDPEIIREGHKAGDIVEAGIDERGAAWFDGKHDPPGNSRCVMYPEDFIELLPDNTINERIAKSIDSANEMEILKKADKFLTKLKREPNNICTQLNREEEISFTTGYHNGFLTGYLKALYEHI